MRALLPIIFALATSVQAQTAAEHIAAGDRDYAALNSATALAQYEAALAIEPENYAALWKASRSIMDLATSEADKDKRMTMYKHAEQYARKAVAADSAQADAHFALARALGKTALAQSPRGRVRYGVEVRDQALACLRANQRHAGCLHVMGVWNAEVLRLNGFVRMVAKNLLGGKVFGRASWSEAIRYMQAAIEVEPSRIAHHLDLADIYRDIGDKEKARSEYETVLRLPVTDFNDPGYKASARAELQRL